MHGIGWKDHPITKKFTESQNLRDSLNEAPHVPIYTIHSKPNRFVLQFGRKPRFKLSNLKNAISDDSKDLSVYITRSSTGDISEHLDMPKKKNKWPQIQTVNDNCTNGETVSYRN